MGVDYDAEYGIGYEVVPTDKTSENFEYGYEAQEYLEEKLGGGFRMFIYGDGAYMGDDDIICVVLNDPFKDGLDLSFAKQKLDAELDRLGFSPTGDFDMVGGLHVY